MRSRKDNLIELIELNNVVGIKKYIMKIYNLKPGPSKLPYFYKIIVTLFDKYPLTIYEIIDTVPTWGYYKDYMFLLVASQANTNEELTIYIYNLLKKQFKRDTKNYFKNSSKKRPINISTLAKWLPREKSSFDKKLHFVNRMSKLLYPSITTRRAKIKYRKACSKLNKHLNTTEVLITNNQHIHIDFTEMYPLCLKNNLTCFINNPITNNNLTKFLTNKYNSLNPLKLISHAIAKLKLTSFEKKIINNVWNNNFKRFITNTNNKLKINTSHYDLLIDLSKSIHDNNFLPTIIYLCMIAIHNNSQIIINSHKVIIFKYTQNMSIFDVIEKIEDELTSYSVMNIQQASELTNNKLLVITNLPNTNDTNNHTNIIWNLKHKKIENNDNTIEGNIFNMKRSTRRSKRYLYLQNILEESIELRPPNSQYPLIVMAFATFGLTIMNLL